MAATPAPRPNPARDLRPEDFRIRAQLIRDRDRYVRLFNRLDAAISHHRKAKQEGAFCDDADDALHAAHDRVLKVAGP